MQNFLAITAAAALSAGLAAPAIADNHMDKDKNANWKAQSPEIVERNDNGKATKVRIDGKVYEVCMSEKQDSCIQPRAAGLKWGDMPLRYWPGQTASQS
jgi:hypothetical protein